MRVKIKAGAEAVGEERIPISPHRTGSQAQHALAGQGCQRGSPRYSPWHTPTWQRLHKEKGQILRGLWGAPGAMAWGSDSTSPFLLQPSYFQSKRQMQLGWRSLPGAWEPPQSS